MSRPKSKPNQKEARNPPKTTCEKAKKTDYNTIFFQFFLEKTVFLLPLSITTVVVVDKVPFYYVHVLLLCT